MDANSINSTCRRTHPLKPNIYYELTNGVELKLADIRCIYYHKHTAAQDGNSQVVEPGDCDVASTTSTPNACHSPPASGDATASGDVIVAAPADSSLDGAPQTEKDEYDGSTDNEFGKCSPFHVGPWDKVNQQ